MHHLVSSIIYFRLSIQTKPLDIVYNPTTFKRVKEFFSTRKKLQSKTSQLRLTGKKIILYCLKYLTEFIVVTGKFWPWSKKKRGHKKWGQNFIKILFSLGESMLII